MTENATSRATHGNGRPDPGSAPRVAASIATNEAETSGNPPFGASALPAGQRLEAYRMLFGGSSGQRVLLDLLDRFGFLSRPTLGPDPQTTAYHEGQRSVVMAILRNAGIAPRAFPQVVSEHVTGQYRDLYGDRDGID